MPIVTSDTPEPTGWKYGIGQGGNRPSMENNRPPDLPPPPPPPMQADTLAMQVTRCIN